MINLKVDPVDVWHASIDDKPGSLAKMLLRADMLPVLISISSLPGERPINRGWSSVCHPAAG